MADVRGPCKRLVPQEGFEDRRGTESERCAARANDDPFGGGMTAFR